MIDNVNSILNLNVVKNENSTINITSQENIKSKKINSNGKNIKVETQANSKTDKNLLEANIGVNIILKKYCLFMIIILLF